MFPVEDASLLTVMTQLLTQYLAGHPKSMRLEVAQETSQGLDLRQEQLEVCVLLYTSLTVSFRGTHQHMMKVSSL